MSGTDETILELVPFARKQARIFSRKVPGVTYEEMASAATFAVVESVSRYDGSSAIMSYAYPRIKGQMVQDMRTIKGVRCRHNKPDFVSVADLTIGNAIGRLGQTQERPDVAAERSDTNRTIRREVNEVIRKSRHPTVARLHFVDGHSEADCVRITGLGRMAVRLAIREGRRLLRANLERLGME